jgi:hypothetical protein
VRCIDGIPPLSEGFLLFSCKGKRYFFKKESVLFSRFFSFQDWQSAQLQGIQAALAQATGK